MVAKNVPTRELGYVNPYAQVFYQANYDADEITAALVWPNNLRVYDQMVREDSQISAVLRAVTLPIRRTAYRIDPQAASDDVVRLVAEDLGLPVLGRDPKDFAPRPGSTFSWGEHLRQALLELRYGHMFFERVYEIIGGQARLAKLSPRMPRTIYLINVAANGDLLSIEQLAPGAAAVTIPANRIVAYVNEMEGANWFGTSLLRAAYKHWLIKDRLLRVQAQSIDRNGMGIPVYKGAPDKDGEDMDAGLDTASSIRSGDNSGTAIPAGSELELMGVTGTLPNAMEPINYHDQQIARAMLAHFLNLGTQTSSATGSYNLGSQFADFFAMSLQTIAEHVCDVATRSVIADLVAVNFGPDTPIPRLICDDIGSQHDATAQAILMLVQAGALAPDRALEQFLRLRYGMPMADSANPMPNVPKPQIADPAADDPSTDDPAADDPNGAAA